MSRCWDPAFEVPAFVASFQLLQSFHEDRNFPVGDPNHIIISGVVMRVLFGIIGLHGLRESEHEAPFATVGRHSG